VSFCTFCGAGFDFVGEHRPGCMALQPVDDPASASSAPGGAALDNAAAADQRLGRLRELELTSRITGYQQAFEEARQRMARQESELGQARSQLSEATGLLRDTRAVVLQQLESARAELSHEEPGELSFADVVDQVLTPIWTAISRAPAQAAEPTMQERIAAAYGAGQSEAEAKLAAVRTLWRHAANISACSFGEDIEREEAKGFREIGKLLAPSQSTCSACGSTLAHRGEDRVCPRCHPDVLAGWHTEQEVSNG